MLLRTNRGITLVELLAVIVILGIVSSIAVCCASYYRKSKRGSVYSDAYVLYEAARLYVGAEKVEFLPSRSSEKPAHKQLVEAGLLHPFQDPFTGNMLPLEMNPSLCARKTR
jgi:prepilin-type N-terminal cleavage/methylation domain-containing protein